MINYDLIIIGTGSGMNFVNAIIDSNPEIKIAVIDKDAPGGICLTRGCIPSKLLIYPAELIRDIESAERFGINVDIQNIDFKNIMDNMRDKISSDINMIRQGLSESKNVDYYPESAEFVEPYTMKVGNETIYSDMIFICTGSKPVIPPVKSLNEVGYLTSDTVLEMDNLPGSIAVIGGGYIAAEYGHFFSAMGSNVTLIGRNPQFVPEEEPEISALATNKMSGYMNLYTNHEAVEVQNEDNKKKVIFKDRGSGEHKEITVDDILVATGRGPNTDILRPEKGGIETDEKGWIKVDDHLETSKPNVWALGDANGKYLLKHVANYESNVVYQNAILNRNIEVDYHAVPHAVFSHPEIASVGLKEKEAVEIYGEDNIIIGFYSYEETAKGQAMKVQDDFVKIIMEYSSEKILGAHIIGPYASILIHQIIPLMYTPDQSAAPIMDSMTIHPSLSEVVTNAFYFLMPVHHYHHILEHLGLDEYTGYRTGQ
ncbi:FAD-dependent pyridine nucleotide-disulfide oxidoreductase [Methanohalobium evestigatum Z-7303]|uniref:FAD-dependent pyridine nucleotide-disulfide oxidoreductase n=1 Tax=Methanohalobium evestigatum (strain ATCC BAA-1072 / DSM 3721 / NBRC 107634 / OCM 161 / Z-7303) TaxID=644295 RepID=D7E642_METEZ|nr:dihydrolipoyl dehydrogenase [Methanohalobium evestigatum]ADI73064.1 FAD-dependent pyridine nucleotide-disulfide oxidoreductase [Methanohalobium evestigatum Z-7303]